MHTHEEFEFVANAGLEEVFPLFGAEGERAWAEDWNPEFLWPEIARDREGMVFRVMHGDRTATWINTVFDREACRVQYVYVLPDVVATLISIRLRPQQAATHVTVRYERTSLSAESDAVVQEMAGHDAVAGAEWARQINRHLMGTSE